jgi:flagellar protein FlaG
MSKNMEVIDMYVVNYVNSTPVSINSTKSQKKNTKSDTTTTQISTEGETQQITQTETTEEELAAENEKIKKALENMKAQLPHSEVKFGIHEETNRVTIKLVDKDTKEVIKEFPPEKTLDMIAKCMEIAGVLVDEKL